MNSTIHHFDTAHVTIHPQLKGIPALGKDTPEFAAIALGVRESGLVTPLICDPEHRVLDDHSRTLLEVAKRWQILEVPIVIRPAEEAPQIALHSLLHRRHLSKSALAYLAYPLVKPAFEFARKWRMACLVQNKDARSALSARRDKWANFPDFSADLEDSAYRTPGAFAERLGIGTRLLEQAQEVHKEFAADHKTYAFETFGGAADGQVEDLTLKAYFEPRILAPFWGGEHEQHRPLGLGAVIAGITAVRANRQKFNPHGRDNQLELFTGAALMPVKRWNHWAALDPAAKKALWEKIDAELDKLSDEAREEAADFYAKLASRCRRGGAISN